MKKTGGGEGFADVWLKGRFAWEYKGKHKNLTAAYQQLLQYREDLENPPLLVVCDLNRFEVHTNFTNTVKVKYSFTLADLGKPDPLPGTKLSPLDVLRAVFDDPTVLRPQQTTAEVTERAAAEFARLADSLRASGVNPEEAAHFLMRLLFCLFAEDIGLLPPQLFARLVESTRTRPSDFSKRLGSLFDAMATGGYFGSDDIKHFDGGLFADSTVLSLSTKDLEVLSRASKLNWSNVEPAIFGTLFERSLDPDKRSQLGAHYTSRADILLIVEPVLMEPLRREWADVREQANAIIAKRDAAKGAARTRHQQALQKLLIGFSTRLSEVKVLDPACGSGNFLYVALRELLTLEKEVVTFAARSGMSAFFPQVGPAQLRGIEVNPYAQELASIVVQIGFLQWWRENGFGDPAEPVLKPLHSIRLTDAILARNQEGQPVDPTWPDADVIIGNPPFLGGNKIRQVLGDEYVESLFQLFQGRVPAFSDLVCYWYERARETIACGRAKRAGLLATQAIRGGVNRRVLERIKESGDIFFAWSDRNWILDGATVHVSIVGFDNGKEQTRLLNGTQVVTISADLTTSNVLAAQRLAENADLCFYGSQQKGAFDITPDQANEMLGQINPYGRDNHDVVKPAVNATQLLRHTKVAWVIDFGVDMPMEEAALYEAPFEYVKNVVWPERRSRNEKRQRDFWWLHARPSPRYRALLAKRRRYIVTPGVGKHRIFAWLDSSILADHALVVYDRDDDYFFGVLQSKPHELWARLKGTQLREAESGCRYTPSTAFETFPFPWPPSEEPVGDPRVEAISQAARALIEFRDASLNPPGATEAQLKALTLTGLYNGMKGLLPILHQGLDAAVFAAYGWLRDLSDEEILSRLLALNLERAATQGGVASTAESEAEVDGDDLTRR